jgi:hypothetical protein
MLMGSKEDSGKKKDEEKEEGDEEEEEGAVASGSPSEHMPADTLQIIGGLSLLSLLASLLPIDPATAAARYGGVVTIAVAAEQYRRDLNALALQREEEAALRQEQLRAEEQAAALIKDALFQPEKLPVTHWKPR